MPANLSGGEKSLIIFRLLPLQDAVIYDLMVFLGKGEREREKIIYGFQIAISPCNFAVLAVASFLPVIKSSVSYRFALASSVARLFAK